MPYLSIKQWSRLLLKKLENVKNKSYRVKVTIANILRVFYRIFFFTCLWIPIPWRRSRKWSRGSQTTVFDPRCWARLPVLASWGRHHKYHRLSGLHNRNWISHSSGGWKSEIRVWAGLVPSEAMREDLLQASPRASGALLAIRGFCCITLTSVSLFAWTSLCVCVSKFPLFIRTQPYCVKIHPSDLILTRSSTKTLFLSKVMFWGPGG